jgi:hypothetical protein
MTEPDPERKVRLAEIAEHHARRERLASQYGMPEPIRASTALALARNASALTVVEAATSAYVNADDVHASIYRDDAAADAWLESNLVHNGHPVLAKVPLPDGRVVGIMDLRPALKRAREEK